MTKNKNRRENRLKKRHNLYIIRHCNFDERPVLKWGGTGEVPYSALPKDKKTGYAVLPVKIDNPYRKDFESAFLNNVGCLLEFSGVIKQITKKGIMFRKVLFTDVSCYWDYVTEYCEEHVWIKSSSLKEGLPFDVKVGDTINFYARIILYRRTNGTLDYALMNFKFLDKNLGRKIPTREELDKEHEESFIHRLKCITCLYYDKCDLLNCIMY